VHTLIIGLTILACGIEPVSLDMAGKYSSVLYGFMNFFGQVAGLLCPRVMGWTLDGKNQGDPQSWNTVCIVPLLVGGVTMGLYTVFGTSERRPWATENDKTTDETKILSLQE